MLRTVCQTVALLNALGTRCPHRQRCATFLMVAHSVTPHTTSDYACVLCLSLPLTYMSYLAEFIQTCRPYLQDRWDVVRMSDNYINNFGELSGPLVEFASHRAYVYASVSFQMSICCISERGIDRALRATP